MSTAAKVGLAAAALAATLLVVEVGARLLRPEVLDRRNTASFTRSGDEPGQPELIPGAENPRFEGGAVRVNSLGLRGPELGERAATRVLAVGDSVTFGFGVAEHEAWPAQLAEALGEGVEVLNAGVSGAGLKGYVSVLRRRCAQLEPDLAIVGLTLNDVAVYPEPGDEPLRTGARLAERSHVVGGVEPYLRGTAEREGLAADPTFRLVALGPESERLERAWSDTEEQLGALRRQAERCGVPWVLTAFPVEPQLADDGDTRPQARLAALADGVQLIDLLPAFREARHEGLFLGSDGEALDPVHPSPRGHAVAAEVVAEAISELATD